MRTPPSAADVELLQALAQRRAPASTYQLERWRRHGLLPRARVVRSRERGTRVLPHDGVDLEIAETLARASTRGREWQRGGVEPFERGLPLTQRCLRDCATWLLHRPWRPLQEHWERAVSELPPGSLSDEEVLADVAALVEEMSRHHRATRGILDIVRQDLETLRFYPPEDLDAAAHHALGLRLVELTAGPLRAAEQRHIAGYGSTDAPTPRLPFALPGEQRQCAATVTTREATVLARLTVTDFIRWEGPPPGVARYAADLDLLHLVIVELTRRRLAEPPYDDPAQPLDPHELEDLEAEAADAESALERDDGPRLTTPASSVGSIPAS